MRLDKAKVASVVHTDFGHRMLEESERAQAGNPGKEQVWIEDHGPGIDMGRLPKATLDRGFTTAGTLGHGFKLLLATADRVWLLTGPTGTTVVLQQGRDEPVPDWLDKTRH